MTRPRIYADGTRIYSLTLPPSLVERIDQLRGEASRSRYVTVAFQSYCDAGSQEKPRQGNRG